MLEFDDQSASFVHGFEAGQLYRRMKSGEPRIEQLVNAERVDFIRRMADSLFYDLAAEAMDDHWATVILTRSQESPVRKRLKLVD